ncbi:Zinc D-Ala-D-Ala carboxypeptidase precursor [Hartmannibacter diazotrophicus]|uniref:Zinc D-Ala-D-Ala carboxypeptidase n=1 Tax=Hartmannibacter diazotrophicus TaxID=1482074 RepID=A0A2C9D6I1_9HYPH|nr:peptidoglycan-binding protein [Hartmannibacter diazotrophicus]SON55800.1 Zinc D-Ala-D-Ala carboxypeptidase precursor [Hartmannibacter diazotrophicus]
MASLPAIDNDFLTRFVPPSGKHAEAQRANMAGLVDSWGIVAELAELTTPLRVVHFLCQTGHECDRFRTTEEYASGRAYEGRADLGNTRKGDGARFKGRGIIQTTGRANCRAFTAWIRKYIPAAPDFEAEPERLAQFPWAALSAAWYWQTHNLNRFADRDDVIGATRAINGGLNGLDDRRKLLGIAKTVMAAAMAGSVAVHSAALPTLHRGSDGDAVATLQRALRSAGYHIATDGDFGPATELAVRTFQQTNSLIPDGIVGRATWGALARHIDHPET